MNRRELFSRLASLGIAAKIDGGKSIHSSITQKFPVLVSPSHGGIYGHYRGFMLHWTGWKEEAFLAEIVAQWYGYGPSGINAYVSNPGAWGFVIPRSRFDISYYWPQILTSKLTPEGTRQKICREMYSAIKRLIDYYWTLNLEDQKYLTWMETAPLTHPEFPGYYGWRDLRDAGVYDEVAREVRMEQERVERGGQVQRVWTVEG